MGMGAPCPLPQLKLRGCFGCLLDLQRCVSTGHRWVQGQLGWEVTDTECVHTQGLGAAAASLMATVLGEGYSSWGAPKRAVCPGNAP